MDEVVIKVDGVSKDFRLPHHRPNSIKSLVTGLFKDRETIEAQHALKDISFEVKQGEFFGIVGRNGSGKSTLLKILAGIYQPTKGQVSKSGRLVPFIELGVGFNPELTGRENVYLNGAMLGFSEKEVDSMYDDIVNFAELGRFMDQKLKNYSSGMQVRLAFAMATRSEADILLVDEILAVGDADFQRKCFRYFKQLKHNKKTAILVTHDMDAVREYCDRAMLIDKQEVVTIGNPDTVAQEYTKLMTPNGRESKGDQKDRWGDGTCRITGIDVVKHNEKELTFKYTVKAKKLCKDPVYGFRIRNSEGVGIVGTNSLILGNKPEPLQVNEQIDITWNVPNIFTDGDYYIDPAVVYEGTNTAADWWDGATQFNVIRERRSPYAIQPEVKVEYKRYP